MLIDEEHNYSKKHLPWFERTFSAIETGSQRGAILLVLASALGTGIFTLHKTYVKTGFVFASMLVFIVGFLLLYSSKLIIHASRKNPECNSLPQLAEKLLGASWYYIYNGIFSIHLIIMGLAGFLAFSKTFYYNFENLIWKIFPVAKEH